MNPVVGTLELASKIRHGFTKRGVPLYMFYPYDEDISPMLVSYKGPERINHIALAVLEPSAGNGGGPFPRGGLREILGPAGQESVELEAIQWQHAPTRWKHYDRVTIPVLGPDRVSLIHRPTINIDPHGCRDIDDVVSLWSEDGIWNIAVSISDVSSWVTANSELRAAQNMGQTLYRDGAAVVPMFPAHLSEDLLSLKPGVERAAISLLATWNGSSLSNLTWKRTVIKTWASYTYESCYQASEIDVGILRSIAKSVMETATDDSHTWIEALMIWYNTEAARVLLAQENGILRTHGAPDIEKIAMWERLGLPAKQLAYPAAVYTAIESGGEPYIHWGLSKQAYCHASSPIRRYADIVNQELLVRAITGAECILASSYVEVAQQLQILEKRAKRYERDLLFIRAFYRNKNHTVKGVLVDGEGKVYVEEWKRIIKCEPAASIAPGTEVLVSFYAFLGRRSWKKKMVFKIQKSTDI